MENIKLYELLKSPLAINEDKGADVGNTILAKYNNSKNNIIIDFSNMRVIISPFMRSLIKPLFNNNVSFEGKNFDNERNEDIYNRVIEEFKRIGTENIRELNV